MPDAVRKDQGKRFDLLLVSEMEKQGFAGRCTKFSGYAEFGQRLMSQLWNRFVPPVLIPFDPSPSHDRSLLCEGEDEEGDVITTRGTSQERTQSVAGNVRILRHEALQDIGEVTNNSLSPFFL